MEYPTQTQCGWILVCILDGLKTQATFKLCLYKPLCTGLENNVQFRLPHFKEDTVELEKVQKRTTKMIRGREHFPYKVQLQCLGLFSLEKKQLRVRGCDYDLQNYACCAETEASLLQY